MSRGARQERYSYVDGARPKRGATTTFLTGIRLRPYVRSRRYGPIIKEFVVGKDDFSNFLKLRGFRGIFGRL